MADVEYPPLQGTTDQQPASHPDLSSLTSVRHMRAAGCVMFVSVLLTYAFLIVYATKRRKTKAPKPVPKAKEVPPALPCEIRVRRVQQDLGIEVALMDLPSRRSGPWSLPIKNRAAWLNKQGNDLAAPPPMLSPAASTGNLTRSTVILETSDSISTPQNHCSSSMVEVLSDCGSAFAPSDESAAMMVLPQKYLPSQPQVPPNTTRELMPRQRHIPSPVTTPRKQATFFPPPMRHSTPRPSPSSSTTLSSTPSRFFTAETGEPVDVPSDEEDDGPLRCSPLSSNTQWKRDADAVAVQELISHHV